MTIVSLWTLTKSFAVSNVNFLLKAQYIFRKEPLRYNLYIMARSLKMDIFQMVDGTFCIKIYRVVSLYSIQFL